MNTMLLIGLIFLGVLVVFLMIAFFTGNKNGDITKYQIIRFITSLCGGFSLAFIGGGVTFEIGAELESGQEWAISSFGGAALFLIIWFTYGKYNPPIKPTLENGGVQFSIPKNISFGQGIKTLVKGFGGVVDFENFTNEDLKIKLDSARLNAVNKVNALSKLSSLSKDLPSYNVVENGNVFTITKI